MAFFKSAIAAQQAAVATMSQAGTVLAAMTSVDLSAGFTAASDEIDLAVLPAGHRIVSLTLVAVGGLPGGLTADVGFLDGDVYGDDDRTLANGVALEAGLDVAGTNADALAPATLVGLAASNVDRAIGVNLSADVPAGAGKKLYLLMEYGAI